MRKNIKGIILSAGESKRMGEPKSLLKLGGKLVINKLLDEYLGSFLSEVVLVLGYRADFIKSHITVKSDRLKIVVNPDYKREMFSSIQTGLSAINDADSVLIGLIDQPFINSSIINEIILYYEGGEILIPIFKGRKGHPIVIPFELKTEILELDPMRHSLRDVINVHSDKVRFVEIQDESILFDMDRKEDYERAKRYEENKN